MKWLGMKTDELHERGWRAREGERFEEALAYLVVVLKKAGEEKGDELVVEVLKDMSLVWKHLFLV